MLSSEFALTGDDARAISGGLVRKLAERGAASICLLTWPKDEVIEGSLSEEMIDDREAWESQPTNLYLSLVPQ